MVDFTGNYIGTDHETADTRSLVGREPPFDGSVKSVVDTATLFAGAFVNRQPIDEFVHKFSGAYLWSFFEDYYNHIYVIPASIDFGTISTNTFQIVTIWNAYLTPKQLVSISPATDTSITHDGIVTPISFKTLEMKTMRVNAAAQGSAVVNTHLSLNFGGLEPIPVNISGIRARFWEWLPNWSEPVSTVLSYKTEIFRSRSGKEQRSSMRDFPRRTISFRSLARDEGMRDFQRYMSKWFSRPALIPSFSQSVLTEGVVQVGDAFMELTDPPAWMTPQTNLVFMHGDENEIKSVLNVVGNRVNFTASISKNWPVGTVVYYGVSGRLANNAKVTALTNQVLNMDVKFEGEAGGEFWPEAGEAERTLDGYELFMKRPNYAASLQMDLQASRDVVDFDVGNTYTYVPEAFMAPMYQNEYHLYSQAEIWDIVNFFRRMEGQLGEFYAPTWTEDIRMMVPTVPNTANIRVKGQDFANDHADSTLHQYVLINIRDGRHLIRKVHQIFPVSDSIGDDSNIQLTEAWNEELVPDMINSICWIMRCRLASDSITISQRTSEIAIINLSIKNLEVLE